MLINMNSNNKNTIAVPKKTFKKMVQAVRATEEAQNYLEDFLILSSKSVQKELASARLDHTRGRVNNWRSLKASYGI